MPSTNKTPRLGLNNWVGTDKPKRTDFVEDNTLLDTAVGAHLDDTVLHLTEADRILLENEAVLDLYVGTGAEEGSFELEFEPKAILIFQQNKPPAEYNSAGYLQINSAFASRIGKSAGIRLDRRMVYLQQSQSAPAVGGYYLNLNKSYGQYFYIALR